MSDTASDRTVRVPRGLYWQSRLFAATAGAWRRLGDLESAVLRDDIEATPIDRPIYVSSLARAGTTIVTELVERHPDVTSHRYSDFPNVWTPYWRNYLLQRTRHQPPAPEERAHRDRIRVSRDSPEAVEEVLWRHFFPGWMDRHGSQVMGPDERREDFDAFYQDHIRKLLAVRGARRYLAKGNYNLARLDYLQDLFPDARFLVPLRDPVSHIASLAKQHALFCEAARHDPRVPRQMAMAGHYEFGPLRALVDFGAAGEAGAIRDAWRDGREVEGWARYWAASYRHLARRLERPALRDATLVFRYEDLCRRSDAVIDAVLAHCELPHRAFAQVREEYVAHLSLPDYYAPTFNAEDSDTIHRHCAPVLEQLSGLCLQAV